MTYADYDFYKNEYFGMAITEDDFPRLALRGSQYIDYITQGRAEARANLEAVKMCCCELAEQYQAIETAKQASVESLSEDYVEIQSETVAAWSRSYGNTADMAAKISADAKSTLYEISRQYLTNTGLLYRGMGCTRCV